MANTRQRPKVAYQRRLSNSFELLEDRRLLSVSPLHAWDEKSNFAVSQRSILASSVENDALSASVSTDAQVASAGFDPTLSSIAPLESDASTGEKPQSKVWTHDGRWFGVFTDNVGTHVFRLDALAWTKVFTISSGSYKADVKSMGSVTHVLLDNGTASRLASLQYVPASKSWQFWATRSTLTPVTLSSGIETSTMDIDSTGRMWVVSDGTTAIEARWSDAPYTSFSAPIQVATGVNTDDIGAVVALPNNTIGVMWSNQQTERFGFKVHVDGAAPTAWSADESPAGSLAQNLGSGFADDHLNFAVASDGTLYVAMKTGYNSNSAVTNGLLVRRPSGVWDNAVYEVTAGTGTRPIVVLNEVQSRIIVAYRKFDGDGPIVYKDSSTTSIGFGVEHTLIDAIEVNDVSSTKQNFTGEVAFVASGTSPVDGIKRIRGTLLISDAGANAAPVVSAGPDLTLPLNLAATLDGTVTDDGNPNPPSATTSLWTKISGPGTVTFANAALVDTTATFSQQGAYVLRLEANDGQLTTFDTVTVTVGAPINTPPVVTAGPDAGGFVNVPLQLGGSVTDDGLPNPPGATAKTWAKVSGHGSVTFTDPSVANTTATFQTVGTYVLRLTANDGAFIVGDDTTITVTLPPNQPANVDAGPNTSSPVNLPLNLDGTVTDDGWPDPPGAVTSTWTKVSGPGTVTFDNSTAIDTVAHFSAQGTYVLRLEAFDGELTTNDNVTVNVTAPVNFPPTADAGADQSIFINQSASLDGTVTDDGLPSPPGVFTTLWKKVSGPGTVTFASATSVDTTATFSETGTYVLRLEASDGGTTTTDTLTVVVAIPPNVPPVVDAGANQTVTLNGSATLNATVTDDGLPWPPPAPLTALWSKVSGPGVASFANSSSIDTSVTFSAVGVYVLRLLADDGEATTSDDVTVTVNPPPNSGPSAQAGPDQTIPFGFQVTLNATVSDDGLPNPPAALAAQWIQVSGPGTTTFANATAVDTTATFSQAGTYVLRLSVSDGQLTASDDVTIVVEPPNTAPIVDAGPDQTVGVGVAALNGTANDDGLPKPPALTKTWSVVSGPGTVTFGDATAIDTTATFSLIGTYVLRLTCNDGVLSNSDDVNIIVSSTPPDGEFDFMDVSRDGAITPLDALIVINVLNGVPMSPGNEGSTDVNRDGIVTPLDALLIINYLNESSALSQNGFVAHALVGVGPSVPRSTAAAQESSGGENATALLAVDSAVASFAEQRELLPGQMRFDVDEPAEGTGVSEGGPLGEHTTTAFPPVRRKSPTRAQATDAILATPEWGFKP